LPENTIDPIVNEYYESSQWFHNFSFPRDLVGLYADMLTESNADEFILSVSDSEVIVISGFANSSKIGYVMDGEYAYGDELELLRQHDGAYATADVVLLSKFGNAPIYHLVRAFYTDKTMIPMRSEVDIWAEVIKLTVRLEDDRLVVIE
jgi:hypothetical protein